MKIIKILASIIALSFNSVAYAEQIKSMTLSDYLGNEKSLMGKYVEITDCQAKGMDKDSLECVLGNGLGRFLLYVPIKNTPTEQLAFGQKYCTDPIIWRPECKATITGKAVKFPFPGDRIDGEIDAAAIKWHSEGLPQEKLATADFVKTYLRYGGRPVELQECAYTQSFGLPYCKAEPDLSIDTDLVPEAELSAAAKCAKAKKCVVSVSGWPMAMAKPGIRATSVTITKQENGWW